MSRIVMAVVNDLHCGSTVALCPPRIELDDGGAYEASKAQRWLWQCWGDYWREVEKATQNADQFIQVYNGDMVDGDHHGTPQILSRNPEAQAAVLREALAVPIALGPSRIFVVRGTEAHNGKGNAAEEGVARRWRNDGLPVEGDPETGTASWWHLRMDVQGLLIDVAHHGRTGQREHTRGNAINLYAHDILLSHVKSGDPPPDLCLRAHHHRFNDSGRLCRTPLTKSGAVRVFTNGAWQIKTGWVHSKFADTMADIGGAIVTMDDDDIQIKEVGFKANRGPVCKIA